MDFSQATGVPIVAACIVLIAILFIGGISFAFQGNVQF